MKGELREGKAQKVNCQWLQCILYGLVYDNRRFPSWSLVVIAHSSFKVFLAWFGVYTKFSDLTTQAKRPSKKLPKNIHFAHLEGTYLFDMFARMQYFFSLARGNLRRWGLRKGFGSKYSNISYLGLFHFLIIRRLIDSPLMELYSIFF